MASLGLTELKTEAVLITNFKNRNMINIRVDDHKMTLKFVITQLRVTIDAQINFKRQINYPFQNATKTVAWMMLRLTNNLRGGNVCRPDRYFGK